MDKYKELLGELDESKSLAEIQKLREKMWRAMGFDDESPEQTMLLLIEEVGELAKAIRKRIGMKCDVNKNNYSSVGEEAADVFILLLDLCTILEVDLFEAFKNKSTQHIGRVWKKGGTA